MAKIFGPGGETEFFEITELQKGFEKELKTGEKVAVAPGVREASFLREAPIRAELATLFEQYRDRILNPIDPYQPPVTRFACTAVVRPMSLQIGSILAGGAIFSRAPFIGFTTTLDTTFGSFAVPQCNAQFTGVPDGGGGFNFQVLPFVSSINKSSPSAVEIIVPDYYTLTAYLGDWTPDNQASGYIEIDDISISNALGGGTNYATGTFSCFNMPVQDYVPSVFEIKADLYVPKYGGPFNYGVVSNCSYTLFNYRLTNNYP